ncbi:MAG: adenylate cyclase [Candidatus Woesearchaeota archaeon]
MEIELERTFLAKEISFLKNCEFKEFVDVYIPANVNHPVLRLRKKGNKFELTKKYPVNEGDSSHMNEETIILDENEFNALSKLDGKRVAKKRYYYPYNNLIAEVDVFTEDLKGLVLVDFEFKTMEEKDSFEMPDFCLVEVTQEEFIAGGMICGKKYSDISEKLDKFGYKKLDF